MTYRYHFSDPKIAQIARLAEATGATMAGPGVAA